MCTPLWTHTGSLKKYIKATVRKQQCTALLGFKVLWNNCSPADFKCFRTRPKPFSLLYFKQFPNVSVYLWGTGSVWVAVSAGAKQADELNHAERGEVRGWLWMWEWAEEEEEEKQQELRTLPKQGCVEQMLGAGVDICFIKSWILKWRARRVWEEQKAWLAETKSPVCLHFFVLLRKIHRQSIQRDCVTDSPVSFHLCQSLILRSWPPFLFQPLGIETDGCHPPLLLCAAPVRSHHLLWWWNAVLDDAASFPAFILPVPPPCSIFPLLSSSLYHLLLLIETFYHLFLGGIGNWLLIKIFPNLSII